ncbi:MAG: helix-turn-helix domain-containing protein [Nitrospiraceae bacterium]
MGSVGEYFKQVREAKGLTLEEVASKTRIHPEFLKALEEGNFAKLPDQVFAKGFVRAYARSLGMDEEDTIRRFGESAGAFYGRQGELERLRLQQAEDERRRRANRKITVAAVGVALLGLVLLVSREQSAVFSTRPTTDTASSKATASIPAAKSSGGPVASQPGGDSSAGREGERAESGQAPSVEPGALPHAPKTGTTPSPADRQEAIPLKSVAIERLGELPLEHVASDKPPLVLELEALELSWVVVQVDGASPHEALLRAGERIRWKANDQFTITLGNAGGVRVVFNGKPQGPFGATGKVARDIVLKRGG